METSVYVRAPLSAPLFSQYITLSPRGVLCIGDSGRMCALVLYNTILCCFLLKLRENRATRAIGFHKSVKNLLYTCEIKPFYLNNCVVDVT